MLAELALAFVAGLVTILNPCVLPLIPILVGSALGKHRMGPAALASGLALSFATFGFVVVAFGFQLGIPEQGIRLFAGALLAAAGIILLVPALQTRLTMLFAPLTQRAQGALSRTSGEGLGGQFAVGVLLGLVWAPCVGPTLGAAIAAASQGEDLGGAFITFLVFAAGVALSVTGFAYGSRRAIGKGAGSLQKLARYAKPVFGAMLVLVGMLVLTEADKRVEAAVLNIMPDWLIVFTTGF
ncbi:cytochrome C biogenesis protein [Porphyrobacter sp. TH134]|uniref:cytochrome c biogenesis CcdA family protein n=1 Tax=Porphyrobacter sp. TH134 TaxID=2067450 RepID=UPI000C7A6480|nr:cytochrome c biogenesis CcdA family protein [Porphyrobacter sp. TH134]PLK22529.1 cytochrome C biogenesis protein [Porphyrobacter sp. TH134]